MIYVSSKARPEYNLVPRALSLLLSGHKRGLSRVVTGAYYYYYY